MQKSLNSLEVAKLFGVNVSSVKRWTDAGRLECIRTAGGHRKFLMSHLTAFIQNNKSQTKKINLFPIESPDDVEIATNVLKMNFPVLIDYVEKCALKSQRKQVQKVLSGLYLSQVPLHQIFDELITPVLHRIGILWHEGKIEILDEHLATDTLCDSLSRLQGIVRIPNPTRGRVLCLVLPNDTHYVALKMTDYVLEERGFEVFFGGAMPTPNFKLASLFERIQPNRVYFSSTYVMNQKETQMYLDEALELCGMHRSSAFLGGRGFSQLRIDSSAIVRNLQSFQELLLD
ncbi:MAG: B12-binding domain-containing protein [Calditrichia bacterium]